MADLSTTSFNSAIQGKGYREYRVKHEGSIALPVGAGTNTYELKEMHPGNERIYLEVEFFTSDTPSVATKATGVTGGTVTCTGCVTEFETYHDIENGSFDANTWDDSSRSMPAASGTMRSLKTVFTDIEGDATHAVVTICRHSL